MLVALPVSHPASEQQEVDLATLSEEPFVLFPRPKHSTLCDDIIGACRAAGFEPVVGQIAPQIASIVTLVAAEQGVAILPASMSQLQVAGVAYRPIMGQAPMARIALAYRRGETSAIVRNFIASVVS